jgi:predicted nucleic acid-binding protein
MLVLDANILIRAVLGKGTRLLLAKYGTRVDFFAPDVALSSLESVIQMVEVNVYARFEKVARQRLARRDEDDWPILATALALGYPIWTEDNDFFGCGVATWTSDRVELYLSETI